MFFLSKSERGKDMSFKYTQKMPNIEEIEAILPFAEDLKKIKAKRDQDIRKIFRGEDNRMVMIIGPCSAHNEDAVIEYVCRLAAIQEKVQDKMVIVPRIYTNKPRTTGLGYKGMMHQPDPNEKPNLVEGIKAIRKMHLRALKESGLSSADEMLYPDNGNYLEGILSYVAVGARSTENQQHRLTASGLDIPVGMKNPTSGDIEVMLNSITAGQSSHIFAFNGWEVQTSGNELTHAILRGSTNQHGNNLPNYHYEDLLRVTGSYNDRGLKSSHYYRFQSL